jgi:hypothetical protein
MTGDTPMTLETFSNPQLWNKISGHLEIHEIMEETSSNSKFGKDLRTSAFLGDSYTGHVRDLHIENMRFTLFQSELELI